MTDRDIPIWEDHDVRRIYDVIDGQPFPHFSDFNPDPAQFQLVKDFVEADQNAGSSGPADAYVDACLAAIRAVEMLPPGTDAGWLKFFTYMTDANNHFLWDLHRRSHEVGAIAAWTVETIGRHGWGPDGNASPLGQRHSNSMALAGAAGWVFFPRAPSGDTARQAAFNGHF